MEVRMVKKEEYYELIKLMNKAFEMNEANQFEKLLPKFYYQENEKMIHHGVFIEGKLVASIGLYPMVLVSPYGKLNALCLGAVSTDINYRKQGYFSLLMEKSLAYAKANHYDLMFLTGNRYRYRNYGFEEAGRTFNFTVSQRTLKNGAFADYQGFELNKADISIMDEMLKMYNETPQHIERSVADFYEHLVSWKSKPYYVIVDKELIGYFSIDQEQNVNEFIYKKDYLDTMLKATLGDFDYVEINSSMAIVNDAILDKCDHFYVSANQMYRVFNWDKVAKYLNLEIDKCDDALDNNAKMLKYLGSEISESLGGFASLFVHRCDQG